ncbi:MAG: carbohydrate binding family 9 domain-containing protein [Cytophagaceae bacterium]|nr:carbohydrate binding family 9 domain-containing protein [Gemmatimonadaceae bacterium]
MTRPRLLLLVVAALPVLAHAQGGQEFPGRGAPAVRIPRVTDAITIDGALDEPAWEQAARLTGFSQYQPVDQRPAEEPTEVRVFYTPQAIYFGVIATSASPGSVRATLAKRDNIGNDDRVTIYLDTFNDRRRAFFFGANALGVQLDGVRTEGASSAGSMFGGSVDLNPDFRFETKGRLTPTGYVVEIRIPFKSIRFGPNDPQQWGIQVLRQIPGRAAEDTWTDAQRGASSLLAQSGTLTGITQVERGVVTDIQPFITQTLTGGLDATSGGFSRDERNFDGGVNVRLGFPALAVDGTINPDFSQVEADAGLVTVNERFALFLPERRPFFLEGIELFATPNQLVYSRTIANPIAGAKVTGKIGRLGLAYLSAVDEAGDENQVVNIARLRTDYGSNSVAGVTVTDRRGQGLSNSVIAADTRVVFRQKYYFQTQLGQSVTSIDGRSTAAPVWNAELDRTGRTWGFNYSVNAIGDRFRTAAGFVPRVGFQTAHAFNRIALLGKPGAPIQNFTFFAGPTRYWRYGSFKRSDQVEGTDNATGFITFRGGWSLTPSVTRTFVEVDPSVASGIYRRNASGALVPWNPAGRLSGLWTTSLSFTTPVFGKFNASVNASQGDVPVFVEGTQGHVVRAGGSLTLRPSPSTRIEGTLTTSRITRERTDTEYARVVIPRLKAEFQPTRALFFRVVSQFRSDRVDAPRDPATGLALLTQQGNVRVPADARSLRTDWLVQYEPSPGTTAFFGYGDSWASPGPLTDTELRRQTDGFFLKVAYLFRR